MNWTRFTFLLFAAVVMVSALGCRQSSGKTQVAFITNNTEEFWSYAQAGCKKAEKDFPDLEVIFRRPPNPTVGDQKQLIDTWMDKGIKAVAVSVIAPKEQMSHLKSIAEKIPLLTQDNDAPDSGRLCYIGTDNYEAGKAAGKLVKEAMPNGGTIAIQVGQMEPLNAQQRSQGVLDELAGTKDAQGPDLGKYKLIMGPSAKGVFTDDAERKKSKDNADFVLQQVSGDDLCLVGLWAYNPPTMYEAVKAAGREGKVKIVGFDEMEETLFGIKEGHIHGTIVQQPFEFGYKAAKLMRDIVKGDRGGIPANGILHIEHKVIKKNNVDEFQKYLKELKSGT